MGDMEVGIANGEAKIMAATSSNKDLKPSISFGKFESDILSWEKFSSFSPNKYLEEVEKCATPGSVAQKKAYFESHYKKIAERKVEIILEEEKQLEKNETLSSDVQNYRNTGNENGELTIIESTAYYGTNGESTSKEDRRVTSIATEVNETCIHQALEETMNFGECESSGDAGENPNNLKLEKLEEIVRLEEKAELIIQVEHIEKPEEVVCIEEELKEEMKEDISSKDTGEMKETRKEKNRNLIKKTDKNVQTKHTRDSPKPNKVNKKPAASKVVPSRKTQPSKGKDMVKATNKAASPVSNTPGLSTPRMSKPTSTISSMSTSRSSVKKENVLHLPINRQTAPKTLHISLNIAHPGSDPTFLSTTRNSLIMEQMGDKDIVRRAFKTFQKSFNQMKPSGDGQDTAPNQVPGKATNVSRKATTGQKENGRNRLAKSDDTAEKGSNTHRSSSFAPKDNRAAEKQELSKPRTSAVERIRLQAKKPKADVTNAKTQRQSLDQKAKFMQGPLLKG